MQSSSYIFSKKLQLTSYNFQLLFITYYKSESFFWSGTKELGNWGIEELRIFLRQQDNKSMSWEL